MKTAYVPMAVDFIHEGHLRIINEASKLGKVIVGLLTDKAIVEYKKLPVFNFEQRKKIIENIKGVDGVIAQDEWDYISNIKKIRPDYFVHGDDWKTGIQKEKRKSVIKALEEYGGELIEPAYTKGVSSSDICKTICNKGTTPQVRLQKLKRLIYSKPLIRVLETHNGMTSLIIENLNVNKGGKIHEFDGMWVSSLTDSTSKGKPDIEYVDLTSRLNTIHEVLEGTTKPVIIDGDTGGLIEHFPFTVKTLERLGVSAIIIEDKKGLKKNSLFGTDVEQNQDDIEDFSKKISEGKKAQVTEDFMIIARIESLILKKGINDALLRVKAYIDAGADAIMIHSKEKEADEIFEFCKKYSNFKNKVPLVVVPSTYSHVTEEELKNVGVNIVIYANHMLRSAYPAMVKTAKCILENGRAFEAEEYCMPIKDILSLIPGGK